jgi:pimeloyl-ACP methyl ester carboxylesterase
VFIAPPINPIDFTRALARMLGFGERIRTRMVGIGERRTGVSLVNLALPVRLGEGGAGSGRVSRADLPPALLVHDVGDEVVPIAVGRLLAKSWPGARIVETSGLGHNKILRDETVIAAVAEFIAADLDEADGAGRDAITGACKR